MCSTSRAMPRAKIVCTLGPASRSPERIGELIDAGMNVARLNFSHGSHEDHARMLQVVRSEADRRGKAVAALLDLQGPKIRVGKFANGQIELEPGAEFTITTDTSVVGDEKRVSTTYPLLPLDVKAGDQILLDDGYLVARGDRGRGPRRQDGRRHRRRAQEQQGHQPARRRGQRARAVGEGPHRHRLRAALRRRLRRAVVRAPARGRDRGEAPADGRPGVDPGDREDREAAGARAARRRSSMSPTASWSRAAISASRSGPRRCRCGRSGSSRRPTSAARSSSPRRRCSSR